MNSIIPGEVLVQFTILDRTIVINGEVKEFQKKMEYHTLCLNGTDQEKECEAIRLQHELSKFTQTAMAERQQQIDDLRNVGEKVMTTNPNVW